MSESVPRGSQGRPVARGKQPVVRQRPGQGSGAVPGWMRPQGKTARRTTPSAPEGTLRGTRKAAPPTVEPRLPFVFLDRAHVSAAISKVVAGAGELLAHRRSLAAPLATLLALYLMGAVVFWGRYLPGTRIDALSASLKTPHAVADLAKERVAEYQLTVEGDSLTLALSGEDVGLALDEEAFAKGAAQHTPALAWPVALLGDRDLAVSTGVTFDEERVRAAVAEAVERANRGAEPTTNATVAYQADTQAFAVVKEQVGTELDEEAVATRVIQAIASLQDHLTLGRGELVQPTLFANDARMASAVEAANARKDLSLDLTVWGDPIKTLDAATIRSWIGFDDSYTVTGDLGAITEWAQGALSKELDSAGATRAYVRPDDGKYVEVTGGTYGWVIDGAALADAICERIAAGSSEPVEVPMKSEGAVFAPGGQDWGARYVDVDLSEQYVRFYDSSSTLIFASECVSGDPNMGYDTVTGVYAIYDKESPKKLIGLDYDGDGEPDYDNDVDYWMPFYGGYGFHDASWRSYFGPDAYLYGGSHGCVNLPLDAAQLLYSIIEVDDVVVVHY